MKTSISNLNGAQQNRLHHLSKGIKRTLNPLIIICYGHRASVKFQSSVFLESGSPKTSSSVFDIFLMISDEETLPNSSVLEIARRSSTADNIGNIMVFRMQEVLSGLQQKNKFFSGIFRKGILLHGNKNAVRLLPHPLPPVCFINADEKQELCILLQRAQQSLLKVERNLKTGCDDSHVNILLLNESAIFSLKYYIAAHWGITMEGKFKDLLRFTFNITGKLNQIFPCNTMEELILFHIINLSLIDEGFCPGDATVRTLFKRVSEMIAFSQSCVQRKIAQLLPA
jgi:hypothetical protein